MSVRTFFIFASFLLAIAACEEVPYETAPLGVTSIVNHENNLTQTFTYRKKKLKTFFSRTSSGDTLANIKFYYRDEELISFTSDSTKSSYKRTFIYKTGEGSLDSTYYFELDTLGSLDTTYLVSRRVITYNSARQPVLVSVQDVNVNELRTELTWTGANVTHSTYSMLGLPQELVIDDVEVESDDQSCIYTTDEAFIYILPMFQLYWLSQNNPVAITSYSGTRNNIFVYNKIGYPSSYTDPDGRYGITYTELR